MKKFKNLFILLLIIPMAFAFVGCKNKKPSPSGGGETGTPPAKKTTAEILTKVNNVFFASAASGNNALAQKTENVYLYQEYDNYIYAIAGMIGKIAEIQNIQNNTWTVSGVDSSILGEKANKVAKFKLNQTEHQNEVDIDIYLLFEIANSPLSASAETFDLWHIEVEYERLTEEVSFEIEIEKSREFTDADLNKNSRANYINLSYEDNVLELVTLKRNLKITNINEDVLYNTNSISDFSYLRFNFVNNTNIRMNDSNTEAKIYRAKEIIRDIEEFRSVTLGAVATLQNNAITTTLLANANASKISDIL